MPLGLEPKGLLNKANLAAKRNEAYLIAEKLPLRQKYSLKEFDDITDEIKEQTFAHIQDPTLLPNDRIRVYAQLISWVPSDQQDQSARLKIFVPEQQGFTHLECI